MFGLYFWICSTWTCSLGCPIAYDLLFYEETMYHACLCKFTSCLCPVSRSLDCSTPAPMCHTCAVRTTPLPLSASSRCFPLSALCFWFFFCFRFAPACHPVSVFSIWCFFGTVSSSACPDLLYLACPCVCSWVLPITKRRSLVKRFFLWFLSLTYHLLNSRCALCDGSQRRLVNWGYCSKFTRLSCNCIWDCHILNALEKEDEKM